MQLSDLGDNCFVRATEMLADLATELERELKRKPTAAELAEVLTWGLKGCSLPLVEDADNRDVAFVVKKADTRTKTKLKRGDLFCVPQGAGHVAAVVFLGSFGRFGAAFGVFQDLVTPGGARSLKWNPRSPFPHPLFADDDGPRTGRWFMVSNRPDLAERFGEPEFFHDPRVHRDDPEMGEFGLAERLDGSVRHLSPPEALQLFPPDVVFEGNFSTENFEHYVAQLIGRAQKHARQN